MDDTPDCARVGPLLAELATGAATGYERALALRHVAGCPACRIELADLSRVVPVDVAAMSVRPPDGYAEGVRGLNPLAAGAPMDYETWEAAVADLSRAAEQDGPRRRRWVSALAYPLKEDGRVREVVLMHEDVTARRRAEEVVRRNEAWLQTVTDSLPDEPGGYNGYQALFGHRYVAPELGAGTPNVMHHGFEVTNAAGNLVDENGNQINGAFLNNHPGFPGFASGGWILGSGIRIAIEY